MARILRSLLILGLVGSFGCHQSPLLSDVDMAGGDALLPREEPPSAPGMNKDAPLLTVGNQPPLRTVKNPDAPKRPISLAECIALALENGRTGEFFDIAGSDRWSSVTGLSRQAPTAGASDSLRVFAFDPAIVATEVEQSLARFDVLWDSGVSWNRFDRPSRVLSPAPSDLELFTTKSQYDTTGFHTGLLKPLATGGLAGVSFLTNYEFQPSLRGSSFVNPAYSPGVAFTLEQPLLRGSGVPINQILDAHPGGVRNTIPPGGRAPGILLARIGAHQSTLEFERRVQEVVFRVQEAYWGLYGAYWELYTRENGVKQAHQAWQILKARFDAGGIPVEDLAMVEEQFHFFRTQRLEAIGRGTPGRPGVLEAERRLRYVIGLQAEDGTRLVPSDEPNLEPVDPTWQGAWDHAKVSRPEVRMVLGEIEATELALTRAKDGLKPDLRFIGRYGLNGLGSNVGDSFESLARVGRSEWEVGLQAQVPIGFRGASSEVARVMLLLGQRMAFLRDQEQKLAFSLQRSYRELMQYREEIQTRRSQKEAAALQLKARFEKFQAGGDAKRPESSLDLLLRAQRNWTDAVRDEQVAICNYRVALADFERQKGTILGYHNVAIADGAVGASAHAQASAYLREWNNRAALPRPEVLP